MKQFLTGMKSHTKNDLDGLNAWRLIQKSIEDMIIRPSTSPLFLSKWVLKIYLGLSNGV